MKTPQLIAALFLALVADAASLTPVSVQVPGRPASITGSGASGAGEFAGGGRYVIFMSDAANLVANESDGGVLNVFRRDLTLGQTELVSVTGTGNAGRRPATDFAATPNGRWVAFTWSQDEKGAGDTNQSDDVYLRDMDLGRTRLVSVNASGTGAGNGFSGAPEVSDDGRFVVFESTATSLVTADEGNPAGNVFVRDMESGTTEWISHAPDGSAGDRPSQRPMMSGDGSVVVFQSDAVNLAPLEGRGTELLVWVRGVPGLRRVVLPGQSPLPLVAPLKVDRPVLSHDGRYLAFQVAYQSVAGPDTFSGIWWFDRQTDQLLRASGTVPIPALPYAEEPRMSADGRTLAFAIVVGKPPAIDTQVRIWSPEIGMKSMDELRLSVPAGGGEPAVTWGPILSPDATALLFSSDAAVPEAGVHEAGEARLYHRVLATGATRLISADGVFFAGGFSADGSQVVFETQTPVLPVEDANGAMDVVTTAVADGSRQVVSLAVGRAGQPSASGASVGGVGFSDDGNEYGFWSTADDVVAGDDNLSRDGFVFDRPVRTNRRVDVPLDESGALGRIQGLTLARGGHHVAFTSLVSGLAEGDTNTLTDVFVRDLDTGTVELVSAVDGGHQSLDQAASDPHISADGRWVAFLTSPLRGQVRLYLRDRAGQRTFWINSSERTRLPSPNASNVQLSADGMTLSFLDGVRSSFVHRQNEGPESLLTVVSTTAVVLSADGRAMVAFSPPLVSSPGLYYQRVGSTESRRLLDAPNGAIRDLKLSADGAVLTFARRTNPVAPPAGNPWQVWALSVAAGTEELISVTLSGLPGSADSRDPQISADGRFIVFRSATEDLVAGDDNGVADIFVRDRYTGVTTLLSRTEDGILGNGLSTRPEISGNGRFAAFTTFANNLLPRDDNGLEDVTLAEIPREPAPDTDGDGLPDGWERDQFGSLAQDGAGDADGDGATNAEEWAARTVPTDPASLWRVGMGRNSAVPALQWTGHAGVEYVVERREDLGAGGVWVPVGAGLEGHEGTMEAPLDGTSAGAFYRMTVR